MSTSQRTFDQVKNILNKLDRNIDAARARRTQTYVPGSTAQAPQPVPTQAAQPQTPSTPTPSAQPATGAKTYSPNMLIGASPSMIGVTNPAAPARSNYGRAQPLQRPSNPPTP